MDALTTRNLLSRRIAMEGTAPFVTPSIWLRLRAALGDVSVADAGLVDVSRAVKSTYEIAKIRQACGLVDLGDDRGIERCARGRVRERSRGGRLRRDGRQRLGRRDSPIDRTPRTAFRSCALELQESSTSRAAIRCSSNSAHASAGTEAP